MKDNKVNWGIIAPGHIAHKFALALKGMAEKKSSICLWSVGSRSAENAQSFASQYGFCKSFGSYEEMLQDPELDVVYIASPHPFHYQQSLMALQHGKHVLCEKPACVNTDQLVEVVDLAREKQLFYMEATWTCFNPTVIEVIEKISSGAIGNVLTTNASFCFRNEYNPEGRLFNPDLAGGALLDVGIYPLTFSMMVAKANQDYSTRKTPNLSLFSGSTRICEPRKITSSARVSRGVDLWNSMLLTYADGTTANLMSSVDMEPAENAKDAFIYGTKGYIRVPDFWMAQRAEIYCYTGPKGNSAELVQTIENPFMVNGYEYEIIETTDCILNGKLQSDNHPWQDSVNICKVMDTLRAQWKLQYPFEQKQIPSEENTKIMQTTQLSQTTQTPKDSVDASKPVVVYTDGGCSGNPGPGGWGAVIIDGSRETQLSGGEKNTTNNRMELMAAIKALETIAKSDNLKNRKVEVYSDSQYVKNGITSWIHSWKKNGWKTSAKKDVLNRELWELLDGYYSQLDVKWSWVKGHAGIKYNEICDSLCQKEIAKNQ